MSDERDERIAKTLAEHRRRLRAEFRTPKFDYFRERFGRQPPSSLRRLYELGERLFCSVYSCECDGFGRFDVQNFLPLTEAAVDYCARYDFTKYQFAIGWDGESQLVSIDECGNVFVEWEHIDESLEPVGLSFDCFVDAVVAHPPFPAIH